MLIFIPRLAGRVNFYKTRDKKSMAQLIKRLSKPVKYTASRHEQIFKPNHLLSEKAFFEKEQSRLLFDDFKKQIREVLEDYKSTRQQDRFDRCV